MTTSETSAGRLRVLFADDEANLRILIENELPRMGHDVTVCADGAEALVHLEKRSYDVVIVDLRMPQLGGLEVVKKIRADSADTEAVIMTGHASLETAIEAVRLGAFDYLTKPCKLAELAMVLDRVAEKRLLRNKALALETRLAAAEGPVELVGQSPAMSAIRELIEKVAPTGATVLIQGETGTGKELVARMLHALSGRAAMPFVPVNCAALPEHLVESELLGHRKGAFTGADSHRKGLFEVADGGTLLLDEVGELGQGIQAKLLRFLESGEIRRVGENDAFTVDVRVLCATNSDLSEAVGKGSFREDLFFRVNTFQIDLPALRDRVEDVPLLADHLLGRLASRAEHPGRLGDGVLEALMAYAWPGNVRELANVLEHATILSGGQPVAPEHLPRQVAGQAAAPVDRLGSLRDVEMAHIRRVLEHHEGSKPAAAEALGISLKTLYNKLNQMQADAQT